MIHDSEKLQIRNFSIPTSTIQIKNDITGGRRSFSMMKIKIIFNNEKMKQ